MLFQLHHKFVDKNRTEMVEQRNVNSRAGINSKDWIAEVEKNHPLPEGAVWFVCSENSPEFVTAVNKG